MKKQRWARVREEEELGWPELRRHVETRAEAKARECTRGLIALWMHANRARQGADAALRAHGLSFDLWWVLYVTDELIRETSDTVSQRAVCVRTQLDKATVSYLMGVLAQRDLVDREPEFDGPSYRIWLTDSGCELLARASSAVELAARANHWSGTTPGTVK